MTSTVNRPDGTRACLLIFITMFALLVVAVPLGSFRVDDWTNLQRGQWALSPAGRLAVWTQVNPFSLYRPLVDYWHGTMLALFGLRPQPMFAALVVLMLVQTLLLMRLVRERGAGRGTAALAAAALWAQPNAYVWTALWVSNVTASLLALASLAVLVQHHRAVRHAGRGADTTLTLASMSLLFLAGALCKEEIVLLPGGLAALEWARWHRLSKAERAAAMRGIVLLFVIAACYAAARTHFFPPPPEGNRYHLALGPHSIVHARFYLLHLSALPLVGALLAWLLVPGSRRAATWSSLEARIALREAMGGFAWAAIALALYFTIQGRPAYGYLYLPAFATSYAVARLLGFAVSGDGGNYRPAALVIALHAVLATALTAWGLMSIQWHTYRALTQEAFATLDREMPAPPAGALIAMVDPGTGETRSGRTIYNLVFAEFTQSALQLHYGRQDITAAVVTDRTGIPPQAAIAFDARGGHLQRIDIPGAKPITPP